MARHPISAPQLQSYLDDLEDLSDPDEAAPNGRAAPLPSDDVDHSGVGQYDDLVQAHDMRQGDDVHQDEDPGQVPADPETGSWDFYAQLQAELLKHDNSEELLVPRKKQKLRNRDRAPSSDDSDSGDEAAHGRIPAGRSQPVTWKVGTAFSLGVKLAHSHVK